MTEQKPPKSAETAQDATPPPEGRPAMARYVLPAELVSHLIAEREQLAVQRPAQRASSHSATSAYKEGSTISVKRMPTGFRHSTKI